MFRQPQSGVYSNRIFRGLKYDRKLTGRRHWKTFLRIGGKGTSKPFSHNLLPRIRPTDGEPGGSLRSRTTISPAGRKIDVFTSNR